MIWLFESLKKYGHTWHQMSLLRPDVIKQHKTKPKLSKADHLHIDHFEMVSHPKQTTFVDYFEAHISFL